MESAEERRGTALWLLLVAGFLAGGAAQGGGGRASEVPEPGGRATPSFDLAKASARELRRLPGIGAELAVALVEARWERGPGDPPLMLADVPGIGPWLEGRVRAWLEARAGGVEPSPPHKR